MLYDDFWFSQWLLDLPGIKANHKLWQSIVLHFISVAVNPVKELPTFLFLSASHSLLLLTAYLSWYNCVGCCVIDKWNNLNRKKKNGEEGNLEHRQQDRYCHISTKTAISV